MTRFRIAAVPKKLSLQVRRFRSILRKRCGNVPASLWPNVSAWGGLIRDPHPHADTGHTQLARINARRAARGLAPIVERQPDVVRRELRMQCAAGQAIAAVLHGLDAGVFTLSMHLRPRLTRWARRACRRPLGRLRCRSSHLTNASELPKSRPLLSVVGERRRKLSHARAR